MYSNEEFGISFRQKINEKRKLDRKNLKNWYVRSLLIQGTSLRARDIPDNFMECKKVHIQLKRAIAEKKGKYR